MQLTFPLDKRVKILNWKVKEGNSLFPGNVVFEYVECGNEGDEAEANSAVKCKFKATDTGVVREILSPKGSCITKGSPLLALDPAEQCTHPIVLHDMCGVCSADLRKLDDHHNQSNSASVAMVHSVPGLKVSMEEAQMLGKLDEQHLIKKRKLVLLVDLDQTLIHTTNDNVPYNLEDVFHFQLRSHGSVWYHTRLRPGTKEFLEKMNNCFQLHICTFGTRQYANTIAHYLDPDKKYFSDRILSRDECFSQNSKTANLKELFPRGDHMVCIIDDREDVWNFAPNLIHVKPYHFFRHTGDINAPPGLTKKDNDDKDGFEFPNDADKAAVGEPQSVPSEVVKENSVSESPPAEVTTGNASELPQTKATTVKASELPETEVTAVNAHQPRPTEETTVKDSELPSAELTAVKESKPLPVEETTVKESEPPPSEVTTVSANQSSVSDEVVKMETGSVKVTQQQEENLQLVVDDSAKETTNAETKVVENNNAVDVPMETSVDESSDISSALDDKNQEAMDSAIKAVEVDVTMAEDPACKAEGDPTIDGKMNETSENLKNKTVKPDEPSAGVLESEESTKNLPNSVTTAADVQESKKEDADTIKVEDPDDYLMYLEEILKSIHKAYYELYDDMVSKGKPGVPDVKNVIPYVRRKVLKGTSIVFSGVIPTHVPLEKSRPYAIALSLGAHVSSKIIPPPKPGAAAKPNEPPTTHVVAAREGTAKVNEARKRYKGIYIVTPDWLWSCAERWERVDEKLFLLFKQSTFKRKPPPHCSSPDQYKVLTESEVPPVVGEVSGTPNSIAVAGPSSAGRKGIPGARKERTPSGRFMDTINPLLTFSMDEIESMDHEVDDIFNESDSSSSSEGDGTVKKERVPRRKKPRLSPHLIESVPPPLEKESSSSSNSDDDENEIESGVDVVPGKRKRSPGRTETETEDEPLSAKFRRGEPLPSDLDNLFSNSSDDDDDNQTGNQEDDWMAEALEREFLDENSQDT